jgi:PIN domain nuclease of toxin-antitoxin system
MLLLDSQAALWVMTGNPRLGPQARNAIVGATVTHVSAASIWDLTIKAMLGRLDLPSDFSVRVIEQGLALLDVTAEHAEALRAFPKLTRHDPFDRLIVAQAAVERLTLLTADRVLLGLGRDFVVDATA